MSLAVRRAFTQLMFARAGRGVLLGLALALPAAIANGAADVRAATPPNGERSFSPRVPNQPQHTEYVVEVNRKGQVTRVRSGKSARDLAFDTMTYGNALQAFIRTTGGQAIAGVYRLSYDYAPKDKTVHRSVALLHAGGVDPNALGAVDRMTADARSRAPEVRASAKPLPDFESIEKSH